MHGAATAGALRARASVEHIGYLPQRLDDLDDTASVLDAVCAAAPDVPVAAVRDRLARFLFRGDAVTRPVGSLSGGERFRVALARVLLADPPPQLLVLDEPTNNLDLDTVDQVVSALQAYRGRCSWSVTTTRSCHASGSTSVWSWRRGGSSSVPVT